MPSILVYENTNDNFIYANGVKGFAYGLEYVPAKNVRLTGTYEVLKSYDGTITRDPFTYLRCEFMF